MDAVVDSSDLCIVAIFYGLNTTLYIRLCVWSPSTSFVMLDINTGLTGTVYVGNNNSIAANNGYGCVGFSVGTSSYIIGFSYSEGKIVQRGEKVLVCGMTGKRVPLVSKCELVDKRNVAVVCSASNYIDAEFRIYTIGDSGVTLDFTYEEHIFKSRWSSRTLGGITGVNPASSWYYMVCGSGSTIEFRRFVVKGTTSTGYTIETSYITRSYSSRTGDLRDHLVTVVPNNWPHALIVRGSYVEIISVTDWDSLSYNLDLMSFVLSGEGWPLSLDGVYFDYNTNYRVSTNSHRISFLGLGSDVFEYTEEYERKVKPLSSGSPIGISLESKSSGTVQIVQPS